MLEGNQTFARIELAMAFFRDIQERSVIGLYQKEIFDKRMMRNLGRAGLCPVEIIGMDQEVHFRPMPVAITPSVVALSSIKRDEDLGLIDPGSINRAFASIQNGTFDTDWADYLAGQED